MFKVQGQNNCRPKVKSLIMKTVRILQAVAVVSLVVVLTSCSTSREYASYPPPQPGFSLIISSHPGLIVSRDPYGRYYYRDPRGYVYWRGYDNRYYLDKRYVTRPYYHHQQYNDWRSGRGREEHRRHR